MYLGIDIGGTNTHFGLVDEDGKIMSDYVIPTEDYKVESLIQEIFDNTPQKHEIKAIGVGAPNANFFTGKVEKAPNLNWGKSIDLKELIETKFQKQTFITNDANAAALGEKEYGIAKELEHFVVITLGTGLGSGFYVNGQPLYGATGFAGELGHTIAIRNGRTCGCGKFGCLETYVSSTGIVRTAKEKLERYNGSSSLNRFAPEEISAKEILKEAKKGDVLALECLQITCSILAEKMADLTALFSPQAIILFGGLSKSGNFFLQKVKEEFDKFILPIFRNSTEIMISELNNENVAVLGAAALAKYELSKKKFSSYEI